MFAPETFDRGVIQLRRPRPSDAEGIFECGGDPAVARFMDWPITTSIDPVVERLGQRSERWESGAEFYWVITLPGEDRAIGAISCSVDGHCAEVGFFLAHRYWGRGYAAGAARAVVDWAASAPTVWRVWATCDCENLASARVLEKAGLSCEGTLRRLTVRPNLSPDPRDAFVYARVR